MGILIGLIFIIESLILFSGEVQLGELAATYQNYSSYMLIGISIIKLYLISLCINCGWRGSYIIPIIFSGTSLGFGLSLIFSELNPIFCVMVTCSAITGGVMKKPLMIAFFYYYVIQLVYYLYIC